MKSSRFTMPILCAIILSLRCGCQLVGEELESPRALVPTIRLERLAGDPDLVTPVSCVTRDNGDLFVIESHTHFRPDDYAGPKFDRIWRYPRESLQIGRLETEGRARQLISDSTTHTMQMAKGPDDSLYISTRKDVFRFQHPGEQVIPRESFESILKLETTADYPHNGLSGLVVGPDGWLYVGIGENFGDTYRLIDRHGQGTEGGGEGGSIFRCHLDGTKLERIATGFWNPFALCFDPAGRLWVVDNDPDASPPCRLIHVIPGGDYGFQFRFGRAGTNPLLAWNGELPGTLGYNSGTGEAPSGVVFFRGYLWVTSWGDNCIERYRLQAKEGMLKGTREIVVQGGPSFRPVGIALGKDGELLISDWVDRSYTLHGHGGLWKLTVSDNDPSPLPVTRSSTEIHAAALSQNDALWSLSATQVAPASRLECLEALGDPNPVIRVSAQWGLGRLEAPQQLLSSFARLESPVARVSLIQAGRWHDLERPTKLATTIRRELCLKGLSDRDEDVRVAAVRWVAESREMDMRGAVAGLLDNPRMTIRECRVVLAALDYLDLPQTEHAGALSGGQHAALEIVRDARKPQTLRAVSLQMLDPSEAGLTPEDLFVLAHEQGALGREATRTLALSSDQDRFDLLRRLAIEQNLEGQLRADAVMGLAAQSPINESLLRSLSNDPDPAVQIESGRILRHAAATVATIKPDTIRDLSKLMLLTESDGNLDQGWRVFFRSNGSRCASCHTFQRRGVNLGPELSTLAQSQSRQKILESLIDPSREIAPLFVPWQVSTIDGRVLSGIKLHVPGTDEKTRYLTTDGTIFELALHEIEQQSPLTQSIMPSGLCDLLEEDELRDLMALLMQSSSVD